MRLFIAVRLNERLTAELRSLQDRCRAANVRGNYTKKENLHLTLAFIGEYPDKKKVLDAMKCVPVPCLDLALDGVGQFGSILWAGLRPSPALADYCKALRRSLAVHGIPFDGKPFSPHITLVRREDRTAPPDLSPARVSMKADRVSLMRSDRGVNGMIYTEIGSVCAATEENS